MKARAILLQAISQIKHLCGLSMLSSCAFIGSGPGIATIVSTFPVKPYVAVYQFSPWSNYSFPNGQWLAGDIDGDGKDDLIHIVTGSDYINVWFSEGREFSVSRPSIVPLASQTTRTG